MFLVSFQKQLTSCLFDLQKPCREACIETMVLNPVSLYFTFRVLLIHQNIIAADHLIGLLTAK